MRKATADYSIIVIDDKFVGFSLGHDYCAEHEWGIKGIKEICGIPEASKKNMGIIGRSITKCPQLIFKEEVSVQKGKNVHGALLFTGYRYRTVVENENYMPMDLKNYIQDIQFDIEWRTAHPSKYNADKDSIITAWDGDSFGIGVIGDKEVEYLKELHEAFKNKNITIASTNLGAFSGSSLCLLITDRVPNETAQQMYYADKEYYDREDYEEKIGMKKVIEGVQGKNYSGYKGLHYFCACSPKWIDYKDAEAREEYKKKINTKYDISYWVNYSDDDDNCGWYTVEEIREWLTGTKKLTEIRKGR